jgi:phage antirepressor YoqD-like protein
MSELTRERKMTVKEIADVLNVTPEAIKKHIRKYYPELLNNGYTTYLNEQQITEIKKIMIPTTQVVGAVTDSEMQQKTIEVMQYWINKTKEAELKLKEAQPKIDFYHAVTGSNTTIDMSDVAKVLNITGYGRNKIFEILRNRAVLNLANKPYQKYVDLGYFRLIETSYTKPDGTTHINIKTVVYQKGLDFIRKILSEVKE